MHIKSKSKVTENVFWQYCVTFIMEFLSFSRENFGFVKHEKASNLKKIKLIFKRIWKL